LTISRYCWYAARERRINVAVEFNREWLPPD
jgi:hypothetical protein